MSQPSKEIPMPSQDDYLRSAQSVEASAAITNGNIRHLLLVKQQQLRNGSPRERLLFTRIDTMGRRLEPRDPQTKEFIDKVIPSKAALAMGATAGMLIVRDLHESALDNRDVLQDVKFDPYTHDSELLRKLILQFGNVGLDILGAKTEGQLQDWRQFIFTDIGLRDLFSQMAGLVALDAFNAHQKLNLKLKDIAAFKSSFQLEPEEFDAELAALIEQEGNI